MLDARKKREHVARLNKLAGPRETRIKKNRYYYDDQSRYYRFLVSEGLAILDLGYRTRPSPGYETEERARDRFRRDATCLGSPRFIGGHSFKRRKDS